MVHLSHLDMHLERLRQKDLLREPDDQMERDQLERRFGPNFVDAASNDYLGLARAEKYACAQPTDPHVSRETLAPASSRPEDELLVPADVSRETLGGDQLPPAFGAGASRLIFGTHSQHRRVEQQAAQWLGYPEALLFSSGYAANLGALGALLSPQDAVFSDELNHASIIDGIRLSKAKARIFSHLDLEQLAAGLRGASQAPARWVVVEAYYGMNGDGPDLVRLADLCEETDSHLYIDEAHSLGTFGPRGRGLCAASGIRPDVVMAGFGKAVGSQGGCILGSGNVRRWLWNRARSFVFSTAPSPAACASLGQQLGTCREVDAARAQLGENAEYLRALLEPSGFLLAGSWGPIVALVLGEEARALDLARVLREQGILAQAVRPPSVAPGQSRVRLVVHANHTRGQLERLAQAVLQGCPSAGAQRSAIPGPEEAPK